MVFSDTDLLKGWLERYAGKTIDVVFQSHKQDKTLPQLGYLFGHIIPQVAEYTGYSEEEVYGILKYKFLRVLIPGKDIATQWLEDSECVRSLADCSKEEVAKFIDRSVSWGTQLGAEIFPPDKYGGST